jgi:ribosomal protein S18 acetylase RimI-like enzyme
MSTSPVSDYFVRTANINDYSILNTFLNQNVLIHRHLDWKPPLRWLDKQPFLILERDNSPIAILACPPEPDQVAWIRIFAVASNVSYRTAWRFLWEHIKHNFPTSTGVVVVAIAIPKWFQILLRENNFQHSTDIVVLEWCGYPPPVKSSLSSVFIRPMKADDLPAVSEVDSAAFAPVWRNSLDSLKLAFEQAAYASVAEADNKIIGYQLSTSAGTSNRHLARLAVTPAIQRNHIGYNLVRDLIEDSEHNGVWQITVNTQSANQASINLYKDLGFRETGDKFPVFIMPL